MEHNPQRGKSSKVGWNYKLMLKDENKVLSPCRIMSSGKHSFAFPDAYTTSRVMWAGHVWRVTCHAPPVLSTLWSVETKARCGDCLYRHCDLTYCTFKLEISVKLFIKLLINYWIEKFKMVFRWYNSGKCLEVLISCYMEDGLTHLKMLASSSDRVSCLYATLMSGTLVLVTSLPATPSLL